MPNGRKTYSGSAKSWRARLSLGGRFHRALDETAGVTGNVVAASLGHERVSTSEQSYAKREAVVGAQQRRTLTVLAGGAA